jgi:molecular chaperone GrpE
MGKKADKREKIEIRVGEQSDSEQTEAITASDEEATKKTSGEEKKEQPPEEGEERHTGKEPGVEERSTDQIIAEYEEKIKGLEDRFLRLAAEFDNYRKRTARQFEELIKSSNENIISQILEVADNFERALEAVSKSSDFKSLHAGTEMIYQHLKDVLTRNGVESIEAVGQKFDPIVHEAVMQVESDEYPEGIIVQEIIRGYKLNDKVVRFSKVAVSKGKPRDESEKGEEKGNEKG